MNRTQDTNANSMRSFASMRDAYLEGVQYMLVQCCSEVCDATLVTCKRNGNRGKGSHQNRSEYIIHRHDDFLSIVREVWEAHLDATGILSEEFIK